MWIGTLVGPAAEKDTQAAPALAGPIAVSGIACTGDIKNWLVRLREEMTTLFAAAGLTVPDDVLGLGEAARYRGVVVHEGDTLWAQMASPPSFVARVAVTAMSSDEAIGQAREALRAVYGFSVPGLSGDLREDVIVWSRDSGWWKAGTSVRGRPLGEVFASRHAATAVVGWADDLGTPLDAAKLDLVRSRALVRNPWSLRRSA